MQTATEHMKRGSISLVIKEKGLQTTVRYHFSRTAVLSQIISVEEDVEKRALGKCWRERKMGQLLGKQAGSPSES